MLHDVLDFLSQNIGLLLIALLVVVVNIRIVMIDIIEGWVKIAAHRAEEWSKKYEIERLRHADSQPDNTWTEEESHDYQDGLQQKQ